MFKGSGNIGGFLIIVLALVVTGHSGWLWLVVPLFLLSFVSRD